MASISCALCTSCTARAAPATLLPAKDRPCFAGSTAPLAATLPLHAKIAGTRLAVVSASASSRPSPLHERRAVLSGIAAALAAAAVPPPAEAVGKLSYGPQAVATLAPTSGSSVSGSVTFVEATTRAGRVFTEVRVELSGLKPGAHALNIHSAGDVASGETESYNPAGLPHGDRDSMQSYGASAAHYVGDGTVYMRHAGDLGNVVADASGNVSQTFEDNVIKVVNLKKSKAKVYNVVGLNLVVHEGADDLKTSKDDGNAGKILAYGTIKA